MAPRSLVPQPLRQRPGTVLDVLRHPSSMSCGWTLPPLIARLTARSYLPVNHATVPEMPAPGHAVRQTFFPPHRTGRALILPYMSPLADDRTLLEAGEAYTTCVAELHSVHPDYERAQVYATLSLRETLEGVAAQLGELAGQITPSPRR
jgi:hypothetical protein